MSDKKHYDNDKEHDNSAEQQQKAVKPADIIDPKGVDDMIDRPGTAYAEGKFAHAGNYEEGQRDEAGKILSKSGVYAEAGLGRAHAEYNLFEAEAKGPNASAGAEYSLSKLSAGAMARAEVASASAKAGQFGVKVGLGFDTGASVGLSGVEAKVLETGISLGKKTSVSVLGNEASCSVM